MYFSLCMVTQWVLAVSTSHWNVCWLVRLSQATHVAAQYGQTAFLYHIVTKWNADPDVPDNDGRSPLHWYNIVQVADIWKHCVLLYVCTAYECNLNCDPNLVFYNCVPLFSCFLRLSFISTYLIFWILSVLIWVLYSSSVY